MVFTQEKFPGTSLVLQCLRIHLLMQRTQVQSLVLKDSTFQGTTKPESHNYWAYMLQLLKPVCLEPVLLNKRSHHNEKPLHPNKEQPLLATTRESPRSNKRASTAISKLIFKNTFFRIKLTLYSFLKKKKVPWVAQQRKKREQAMRKLMIILVCQVQGGSQFIFIQEMLTLVKIWSSAESTL